MKARIQTYGGEVTGYMLGKPVRTVQHWQLFVDDEFIADTSIERIRDLYERIAFSLDPSVTDEP